MRLDFFEAAKKLRSGSTSVRRPGSSLGVRDRVRAQAAAWRAQLASWISLILLVAIIVVPLSLFLWLFFFTDMFLVQAVTVVDARPETMESVRDIINERIENIPLGQNIFFVNTESIEASILSELPQVRTVHVIRKVPGTLKAIVQEKEPALLLLSHGNYYFVDQNGVVYEEARLDTLPGIVLPTVKNDDTSGSVKIGVAAVDSSFVSFVTAIQDTLPEYTGAQVVENHIPSLSAREVHVGLDNNWRILFDAARAADGQLSILNTLINSEVSTEELAALEYVDLRIPNRVYYKTSLPAQ